MKEALKSIAEFEDVDAIYYIGKSSETEYLSTSFRNNFESGKAPKVEEIESLVKDLGNPGEAEIIYSRRRIYIRRNEDCFLVIVLGFSTPTPMLQLNCDIAMPELTRQSSPKGLGRFFKR